MTKFEQFMVTLPKPLDYRTVVFAADAAEAVRIALAERLGVPVHEVTALPAAGYGEERVNQTWLFSHGERVWSWNPARIAKKPRGKTEAARAVVVARFRGDPVLPLGMEV